MVRERVTGKGRVKVKRVGGREEGKKVRETAKPLYIDTKVQFYGDPFYSPCLRLIVGFWFLL